MARQFLNYMFCKKIKKNCTTSPSILYSFSSALLQLARHHASAIPPFPAAKLHSHEQATRHHAIILATAIRPRHAHTPTGRSKLVLRFATLIWWVICARLKPSHKHQKYIYCRKLQVSTSICHFNLASWCISRGRFFFVQRIHIHNAIGTTRLSTAAIIHASISILSNVLIEHLLFILNNGFSFKEKTFSRDQTDKSKLIAHEGWLEITLLKFSAKSSLCLNNLWPMDP